jgi:hypothetical protein
MTVSLYRMHILYIYITHNINYHDGIVICFTKTLEFITKLVWILFVLKITKSYTYPHFIYIFLHHYKYLHGLTILGEDAVRAKLGDSIGPNLCDFLGYGSCLAEDHVGKLGNCPCRHDRDSNLISPA